MTVLENLLSEYEQLKEKLIYNSDRLDHDDEIEEDFINNTKQELLNLNEKLNNNYRGYEIETDVINYALTFYELTVISLNNTIDKLDRLIKKINYNLSFIIT